MDKPVDTAHRLDGSRWLTSRLQALDQLLAGGQWRWAGPEQDALRRLLLQLRKRQGDPAWHEALQWLALLAQGERTAAAAVVERTLTLVRHLRAAADRPARPPEPAQRRLSRSPWRGASRSARWDVATPQGPRPSTGGPVNVGGMVRHLR